MGLITRKIRDKRTLFAKPEGLMKDQIYKVEIFFCGIKVYMKDYEYESEFSETPINKSTGFKTK